MVDQRDPQDLGDISGFYDWLAPDYDRMTGFNQRLDRERPVFERIVNTYRIRTAVDAGCGTGFHSILLSSLGVSVTAADVSVEMLGILEKRARSNGLPITILATSFKGLGSKISPPVDAVFCLGNSLAHLRTDEEVRSAFESFAAALRPGGLLVTQTLNYDRILAARERIQSVREAGGVTYVRFYDFEESLIRFNILRLTRQDGRIAHDMRSILLRPTGQGRLQQLLTDSGFGDVVPYGGLTMDAFEPERSTDLVVFGLKQPAP